MAPRRSAGGAAGTEAALNWDQLGSAAASMGIALLIFAAAVAVTGVFLAGWRPWRRERRRP